MLIKKNLVSWQTMLSCLLLMTAWQIEGSDAGAEDNIHDEYHQEIITDFFTKLEVFNFMITIKDTLNADYKAFYDVIKDNITQQKKIVQAKLQYEEINHSLENIQRQAFYAVTERSNLQPKEFLIKLIKISNDTISTIKKIIKLYELIQFDIRFDFSNSIDWLTQRIKDIENFRDNIKQELNDSCTDLDCTEIAEDMAQIEMNEVRDKFNELDQTATATKQYIILQSIIDQAEKIYKTISEEYDLMLHEIDIANSYAGINTHLRLQSEVKASKHAINVVKEVEKLVDHTSSRESKAQKKDELKKYLKKIETFREQTDRNEKLTLRKTQEQQNARQRQHDRNNKDTANQKAEQLIQASYFSPELQYLVLQCVSKDFKINLVTGKVQHLPSVLELTNALPGDNNIKINGLHAALQAVAIAEIVAGIQPAYTVFSAPKPDQDLIAALKRKKDELNAALKIAKNNRSWTEKYVWPWIASTGNTPIIFNPSFEDLPRPINYADPQNLNNIITIKPHLIRQIIKLNNYKEFTDGKTIANMLFKQIFIAQQPINSVLFEKCNYEAPRNGAITSTNYIFDHFATFEELLTQTCGLANGLDSDALKQKRLEIRDRLLRMRQAVQTAIYIANTSSSYYLGYTISDQWNRFSNQAVKELVQFDKKISAQLKPAPDGFGLAGDRAQEEIWEYITSTLTTGAYLGTVVVGIGITSLFADRYRGSDWFQSWNDLIAIPRAIATGTKNKIWGAPAAAATPDIVANAAPGKPSAHPNLHAKAPSANSTDAAPPANPGGSSAPVNIMKQGTAALNGAASTSTTVPTEPQGQISGQPEHPSEPQSNGNSAQSPMPTSSTGVNSANTPQANHAVAKKKEPGFTDDPIAWFQNLVAPAQKVVEEHPVETAGAIGVAGIAVGGKKIMNNRAAAKAAVPKHLQKPPKINDLPGAPYSTTITPKPFKYPNYVNTKDYWTRPETLQQQIEDVRISANEIIELVHGKPIPQEATLLSKYPDATTKVTSAASADHATTAHPKPTAEQNPSKGMERMNKFDFVDDMTPKQLNEYIKKNPDHGINLESPSIKAKLDPDHHTSTPKTSAVRNLLKSRPGKIAVAGAGIAAGASLLIDELSTRNQPATSESRVDATQL